ncbi:MAG: DUF2119 domain-containing protein [Methanosarcinaceae archaeon]|nr:DUF2119 domain-containing protein [Methanosarcinaceae archaeon]
MLRVYGSGFPVRLFVAGMHGDEWRDTSQLLLDVNPPKTGTLAVIPMVDDGKYVSTLDENYYSVSGSPILEAIERLHPEVYLELHSYAKENYARLTDDDRLSKAGVPAYNELKSGLLLGSVSPYIRLGFFSMESLCISFEIQRSNEQSYQFVVELLEVVSECKTRYDFVLYLLENFPKQAIKAIENYRKFYVL